MGKKKRFTSFLNNDDDLANQLAGTSKSTGGGGSGSYGDLWTPGKQDKGDEPVPVLLFKGQYNMDIDVGGGHLEMMTRNYYLVNEHFSKKANRSSTCTAGLKLIEASDGSPVIVSGDGECVGCYYYADPNVNFMDRSKKHVFNAIILDWFHYVDSNRINQRTQQPYKDHVVCEGINCKYCDAGIKRRFGCRKYWPMGKRFVDTLTGFAKSTLGKHCKCGGQLSPEGYTCRKCDHAVRDLEEEPASPREIKQLRSERFKCPECKYTGMLREHLQCNKCARPKPVTLWSAVIEPIRTGEKTNSQLLVTGWGPLEDKIKDKIKDLMVPFEFSKSVYKPLDTDTQARGLGVDNPFDSEGRNAPQLTGHSRWEDDEDDDDDDGDE